MEPDLLKTAFRSTGNGFVTTVIFSLFINLLTFVGPLYMLQIYDRVITSRNQTTLVAITLIAVYMLILFALLEKLRSTILVRLGLLFDAKSRTPLFDAVLKASILQPGKGYSYILRDLDSIREFLTGAGLIAFCDAPWAPIFIAGCFMLHSWFGWTALGGASLIFVLAVANELATRGHLKTASMHAAMAASQAMATLRNAEVLQAMGMAESLRDRWLSKQVEVLELQAAASDRAGYLISATKCARLFLQVAILGIGAYLAIVQEGSPSAMVAASIIMGRALAPVELAVSQWKSFLAARSAYERITTLVRSVPPVTAKMRLPEPKGSLEVEGITVTPPGGRDVTLRNVSFALDAGDILGVIGPSGAGKSTLARALVGVWPLEAGKIRIDSADLSQWDVRQLGPKIGYLPQDVELFSGTIAENICRFSTQDADAVVEAAFMAGVHDMIVALPQGYNTQIGESGRALSGGQRQRIGLARALYGKPALIVLDEPNASLDADGEAALMSAIHRLKNDRRTLILVTHKHNVLSIADKILILADGGVDEFGARGELLAKVLGPRPAQVSVLPTNRINDGSHK